ncbi:MAG: sulfate reduction electron transfer complex DsrMKJOP subunit DsrJ [Bacillota bacterium]
MYNARGIITGLVIFVALVTFPFWFSLGKAASAPEPSLDTPAIRQLQEKVCVEGTEFMRTQHMELLKDWRNSVVRDGNRIYVAKNGKQYKMSLQNTCMDCHSNKAEFCDSCHNYANVKPDCWTCHVDPKEGK